MEELHDKPFNEDNSDFYDLEYFISMEYRYLSDAHASRVRNILSLIGDVNGYRCLDVGGGGGFFANELKKRGANITGIDYSLSAIRFAESRYPDLDMRLVSAYQLDCFSEQSFDLVTVIDVIEHLSNHSVLVAGIRRILKPGGRLIISTDVENGPWSRYPWSVLINRSLPLSADGRAYRLIMKVESYRRKFKDYHKSHIACLTTTEILDLLGKHNFDVIATRIYPLVAVPVRDAIFKLFPKEYRGDHQCVVAKKTE